MLVISIIDYGWMGGYGDRIVGLISLKTIADCLGKEFKIVGNLKTVNHVHDFGLYIGNHSDVNDEDIEKICLKFSQELTNV